MLKYLGLVNFFIFLGSIKYLALKTPDFSLKKYPICHLMTYSKTKVKFQSLLIIFSLLQLFYSYLLCQNLGFSKYFIFFFIGAFFLCLSSLLSVNKHSFLHDLTAIMCVISLSIGVILISINAYVFYPFVSLLMMLSIILLPLVLWLKKIFTGGLWEILLFSVIFSWNLSAAFLIK